MEAGDDGSLDGRRVGSSILRLWKILILEPRISISSLEPHLVKLAYNTAIVSLVSHLNYHRNIWHMQDAQLHKSKLEA